LNLTWLRGLGSNQRPSG